MAALFSEEKRDSRPTKSIAGFQIETTNQYNNDHDDKPGYESASANTKDTTTKDGSDSEERDLKTLEAMKKRIDEDMAEHDDHHSPADHVRDTKPWKLHICIEKRPLLCCLFFLSWFIIVGLFIFAVPDLLAFTTDMPFYIRDSAAQEAVDALQAGKSDATWERQTADSIEKQQQETADVELKIIFIAKNGNDLAQEKYLELMDYMENKILNANGYDDVCNRLYTGSMVNDSDDNSWKCNRLVSLTNFFDPAYFKPSWDQDYTINPSVSNLINYVLPSAFIDGTIDLVNKDYSSSNVEDIVSYWAGYDQGHGPSGEYTQKYYDGEIMPAKFSYQNIINGEYVNFSVANLFGSLAGNRFAYDTPFDTEVDVAMTIFSFGLPLNGYSSSSEDTDEQESDIGEWCYDELNEMFEEFQDDNEDDFEFYWDCSDMSEYYIQATLMSDATWMVFTFLSVYILMIINTGSVWLGSCGMLMIFLNFLPAILLYRFISNLQYFGTLCVMAMFIILAIGADDVFVICDTWAQYRAAAPDEPMSKRLTATLKHAGKVMATTSLSTIFSFVGNTTSVFPAIYTFGAFSAWLVFVNYCSVVIFYPTVLAVHDTYFYTPTLKRGCCQTKKCGENNKKCCGFDNEKPLDSELDEEDRKRGVDKFFEYKFYPFVFNRRKHILVFTFIFFLIFGYMASQLEPDPNPPQFFPDGNNYFEFNGKLADNFAGQSAYQLTGEIVWGIDGIDRDGTDYTLIDDIGEVIYSNNVSILSTTEQEYIASFCDDLLCQYSDYECRYPASVYENLYISDPENYGDERINVVKCFMTEFREWVETDSSAKPNASDIDEILIIYNITDRSSDMYDDCEWGIFPVEGKHCFDLLFTFIWLDDELPTSNPDYIAGTNNYDYWKSYAWVKEESINDGNYYGIVPKFFIVDVLTEMELSTPFEDGIQAWDDWNEYLKMWTDGIDGSSSVDQNGIAYHEAPSTLKSVMIAAEQFRYYFEQRQIVREAYNGIALSLAFAFVILTLATQNWIMALYSVWTIFSIVVCVMGFSTLNGWKLGIIEAIIYVMVVGMSVDYVVHLSEAYLASGKYWRHDRSRGMLGIVGGSVLSGAMSTLMGIFWLFFATITVFYKFGSFIFFLIATSVTFSLISFASAMTAIGPQGSDGNIVVCFHKIKRYFNDKTGRSDNNTNNGKTNSMMRKEKSASHVEMQ